MTEIDDGGPAFPVPGMTGLPNGEFIYGQPGMSLRDAFAMNAAAGLLAGLDRDARLFLQRQREPSDALAQAAFSMADAMLRARKVGAS